MILGAAYGARRLCAVVALVALTSTAAAGNRPPLSEVEPIDEGLFAIGLADQIRKNCPVISPRVLRALGTLQDLQNQARDLGYTQAEIDAHVGSDTEKDRLRARAARYMASLELSTDPAGYCALGQREIERGSTVGVLLRMDE